MHANLICSDRVIQKKFCHYLWLFTSKAEISTSRVRFQCGRPSDHLLTTHTPLLCVERPALNVGKHSLSPTYLTQRQILLVWCLYTFLTAAELLPSAARNQLVSWSEDRVACCTISVGAKSCGLLYHGYLLGPSRVGCCTIIWWVQVSSDLHRWRW